MSRAEFFIENANVQGVQPVTSSSGKTYYKALISFQSNHKMQDATVITFDTDVANILRQCGFFNLSGPVTGRNGFVQSTVIKKAIPVGGQNQQSFGGTPPQAPQQSFGGTPPQAPQQSFGGNNASEFSNHPNNGNQGGGAFSSFDSDVPF